MPKYIVSKRMEIAGSHCLKLNYESACSRLHGHNWIITVYVQSDYKDENGMVIDFKHIKNKIHDKLDHQNLSEIFDFNPTAENIAEWIAGEIDLIRAGASCNKVEVQESEGNIAIWKRD